jgi:hypothetical protein
MPAATLEDMLDAEAEEDMVTRWCEGDGVELRANDAPGSSINSDRRSRM